jgi:hypothetical protein
MIISPSSSREEGASPCSSSTSSGVKRARERDVGVLERVRHAPDAVVVLHQHVLLLHPVPGRVLRERDLVADDLEHVRERWQREHRHYQPLDAGSDDERIGRVLEMVEKVAEEQRFPLLLQTDHRVELRLGAHRRHLPQEGDVRRRHLHVHQEVRAVGREQQCDVLRFHQQGVHVELATGVALDRNHERVHVKPVDDAADDVGRAVAEEQRGEHLELVVRLEHERAREPRPERGEEVAQVAAEIGERAIEPEVEDDVDQCVPQAVRPRIVRAVRRRIGVDVLGRHRGPTNRHRLWK